MAGNHSDVLADDSSIQMVPQNLEGVPRPDHLLDQRHRWNTNEEIAGILINFEAHEDWLSREVRIRPSSGSLLLYSRKKVRYRRDGYCWKKRKDGKTTREDHMKLKVQGIECIYGCYVHSAILPTFHRRCYWLLQNPDIVLVHYLNVPYPDDNKMMMTPSLSLWTERKEWTRDELGSQLQPMFSSLHDENVATHLSSSVSDTVEMIVDQLMERQRQARTSQAAAQLQCACAEPACPGGVHCPSPLRRVSSCASVSAVTVSPAPAAQLAADSPAAAPPAPLVLSVQALRGGTGYLLLPSSGPGPPAPSASAAVEPPVELLEPSVSEPPTPMSEPGAATSGATEWPSATDQDLFKATFDLSLDDIQQTLSASMPAELDIPAELDVSRLGPSGRQEQTSLLDALSYLDDFDFDSLEVGQSEHQDGDLQRSKTAEGTPPPVGEPPPAQPAASVSSMPDPQPSLVDLSSSLGNPRTSAASRAPAEPTAHTMSTASETGNAAAAAVDQAHDQAPRSCGGPQRERPASPPLPAVAAAAASSAGERPERPASPASVKSEPERGSVHMDYREGTANITDFSPEWAYTEGGIKVLVTGPWYATSTPYTVLFDGVPVPTELVQSGVLRCYCPAHEAGVAPLQVACEGFVISNVCLFEYKQRCSAETGTAFPASAPFPSDDDTLVKLTLLQRIQLIDSRTEPSGGQGGGALAALCGPQLEERLTAQCRQLMARAWLSQRANWEQERATPSLLHLAAILGYSRLVCSLLHWRSENPSPYLESEVDAVRTDGAGDTPLALTCARGHTETARLLYQWNHTALRMRNTSGHTPLELARRAGHLALAEELERLDTIRQRVRDIDRGERVFARPGTKYRSELWRQRNLSLDLPSSSLVESGLRQLRSSTPSPQRGSGAGAVPHTVGRRPLESGRSSVDSGLDTLRGERSASLPVASPACSSRCSAADIRDWPSPLCEGSPSMDTSQSSEASEQHVLALAEHIIAAMPERIKIESDSQSWERSSSPASDMASLRSEAMEDHNDWADLFEAYRYCEASTPQSVSSPASSCLPSPCSFSVLDSPSPPPSAADLGQYFKATRRDFALDFSSLTLSDREQRELYEAAKVIQKAYRNYKGRKRAEEQDREKQAATMIQNCYRRYKQYFYYTQMTRAAMVIQNRYRTYCEHKRFKKSQEAAVCIQNFYRQYKEQERRRHAREGTPGSLKRTFSQRRQHQAAMKIQHFMRQSKNKLQKERAQEAESVPRRDRLDSGCAPPPKLLPPPPDVSRAVCRRQPTPDSADMR